MTSRLDRLFLLLDNGSTPLTRKAAALQLGEVQKLHPHELNTLLVKVRQYLHSSSWDTRIAASQAVEAIISNVPLWFPPGIPSAPKNDSQTPGSTVESNEILIQNDRMMFELYDVNTVIKCGHNLLASEGKDFDQEQSAHASVSGDTSGQDSSIDSRESIAKMRQSLNQKLGLSFAEKIGIKMEFISNSDLETNSKDNNLQNDDDDVKTELKLNEIITKATGKCLKRKPTAKLVAIPKSDSRTLDENSHNNDLCNKKIKLEPKEEPEESELKSQDTNSSNNNVLDGEEWPLAWFSDELMGDLFNAHWEVRHGAAIGLREIVKIHGRCGGRLKNAPSHLQDQLNQRWLEDLSLRLLSVLALDKFGDYVSDQVVAPVRETCAQVLGLIIKLLTVQGVRNVLKILLQLLQCPEWEARHGGMLGMKYLLAIRRDMIEQLLPEVFEPVFQGLKDSEDDVSAVAAAALVPVKDDLMRLMPDKVPLVISFLWEALLVLDDLSSSTGDLLMLLSSLLTFKGLEDRNTLLAYDNNQLETLIPRLWPFLSHSLSSVRRSVLESLLILSEKSSSAWLAPSLLSDALRLLYQRSLIENHNSILVLLYKVWLSLISKANYECLIESTRNYVTGWICLMMQPQKIPIDSSTTPVWLEIKHVSTTHNRHWNSQSTEMHQHDIGKHVPITILSENYFIGGTEMFGETSEERERSTIRARYQCARLIGALAFNLTKSDNQKCIEDDRNSNNTQKNDQPQSQSDNQSLLDGFASILLNHLNTKSAVQRMCCAWIIREWANAKIDYYGEPPPPWCNAKSPSSLEMVVEDEKTIQPKPEEETQHPSLELHKGLADRCSESLEEQIFFDEISTYVSRVQYNFRDLLQLLRNNKIQFDEDELAGKTVYTFDQINVVMGKIQAKTLQDLKQKLMESRKPSAKLKTLIESTEERIQTTKRSIQELNNLTSSLSIGVKSSLASALIAWCFIPERLSPIIKPVMDSIKCEVNEQLQRGSASSLVKLLKIFCERTYRDPKSTSPTAKIINNLITYLCSDRSFTPEVKFNVIVIKEKDSNTDSSTNIQNNNKVDVRKSTEKPSFALSAARIVKKHVQYGILALDNMQKMAERSTMLRRSNSLNLKQQRDNHESNHITNGQKSSSLSSTMAGTSSTATTNHNSNYINNHNHVDNSNGNQSQLLEQEKPGEIQRRGATIALSETCRYFGENLPQQLPSLWDYIKKISLDNQKLPAFDENGLKRCPGLIQSLQVFEVIGPYLHQKLHSSLFDTFDFLCGCLQCPFIAIRHMASRCFGMLASIMTNSTMNIILTKVLDMLEASDCELKRQGSVEAIYFVIDRLSLKIVPYIVLLIVPMLGRMSDQNESVRLLATHCFAQLVQLMPLDNVHQNSVNKNLMIESNENESNKEAVTNGGSTLQSYKEMLNSNEIELSEELLKRKENERHFLEQLTNIKKLDDYKLPIPVKAELRQYQQDGLNWLAFLNKYKLHGIVADEMGLGKTLQAICILASDHYYMKQKYLSGESSNPPLLSLVICPPTLTGHWMHEVDKFVSCKYLCPILYTGPPAERTKIKQKIHKILPTMKQEKCKNYNLIIASYDLVRNDIDFFSEINWNYCILDEGHVIKNGKTKLAKSIKTLRANHRLILTGTPIQNNVLELWSLFDFLMPGFLGTERQFMARYSKPILASRDAKSSSKEQEAGILAMESLHRQVLPFILRRMKEDVLKDLPPKIMQDYYCELSILQAQLYEDFYKSRARQTLKDNLDSEVEEITHNNANNGHQTNRNSKRSHEMSKSHIFQSLQYLRKVCNHPKLVLTPLHPNYEQIMNRLRSENSSLSDISHAAKLGALKQLLQDCGIGVQTVTDQTGTEPVVNQHRALIFCQLKSMLDIVEKDLLKTHMPSVSYLRLDGDVPSAARYPIIHRFNNDPSIDVLLLTIQVGGLGLNLTGADTVIFVEHDWNPMKDLQAMDRAHRIGQKKVVNVYRLITTGTLEEKIMGLQKFKLTIANTVISSENSSLDSMATDQLLDLFELSSAKDKQQKIADHQSSVAIANKSDGIDSSFSGSGQVSMKMMLESLPELWDSQQYENEYDLNNFLQSLSNV